MQVILIALGTALLLTGPQAGPAQEAAADAYTVPGCLITLIEDVDVPAQEAGVLKKLQTPLLDAAGNPVLDAAGNPVSQEVREGLEVSENQVLGLIDDQMEKKLKEVAQYKLQVARKEAGNTVSVRAAEAAEKVAGSEVAQAEEANRHKRQTVPPAEMNRMLLTRHHAELQVFQSKYDLEIAEVSVLVREAEDEVAGLQIDRRRIVAPLDGVVVERYFDEGEWVRPGDPVLRVIRINRVRVEGFVDATRMSRAQLKKGQEVTILLDTEKPLPGAADVPQQPVPGEIVFVSPMVEAGPRFRVWAEVGNVRLTPDPSRPEEGSWLLLPGLNADMTIHLKRVEPPRQTAQVATP